MNFSRLRLPPLITTTARLPRELVREAAQEHGDPRRGRTYNKPGVLHHPEHRLADAFLVDGHDAVDAALRDRALFSPTRRTLRPSM